MVKVYLLIYKDPWEECDACGTGIEGYPEILCITFSRKRAQKFLEKRIEEGAKYLEGNTEIEEQEVIE